MAGWSDFSVFLKLVKDLIFIRESKFKALWKLPATLQVDAKFLILLRKLKASLCKPLGFKCNPPLFSSFEVIFPLPLTSICKQYKCSFVLITVKEALALSVLVINFEKTTLLTTYTMLLALAKSEY